MTLAIGTNAGGGTLTGTSATSGNGVATFTNSWINKSGTGYTLTVAASGYGTLTTSSFNITPAASNQFILAVAPSSTATAGIAFATQPSIQVEDTYGNVVASSADTITLTAFTDSGCSTLATGTLSGNNPTNANGSNGTAAFLNLNYSNVQTIYLKASSATVPNALCLASNPITVNPSGPVALAYTTQPSTIATAGTAFAQQPVLKATDNFGNLSTTASSTVTLTAYTNSLCTSGASGTLTAAPTALSSGTVTFSSVSYNTPGTIYLKASSTTLTTACSQGITFSPSSSDPNQSTITVSPATLANDGNTAAVATITVKDAYGNLIPGKVVSLASNRNTSGTIDTLGATQSTTNAAGQALFSVTSTTLGPAQLTASVPADTVTLVQKANLLFLNATPYMDYQAQLFDGYNPLNDSGTPAPNSSISKASWFDLANGNSSNTGTLSGFAYSGDAWTGSGTAGSPYALTFNNGASYVNLGTAANSNANFSFETWINPSAMPTALPTPATLGSVIAGNGYPLPGSTASPAPAAAGMTLRQSAIYPGKVQLTMGGGSYDDEVIADSPSGYWKLNETSGTIAKDYSGNGYNGTYSGTYTLGASELLTGSGSSTMMNLSNGNGQVTIGNTAALNLDSNFTIEFWVNLSTSNPAYSGVINKLGSSGWLIQADQLSPATATRVRNDTSGYYNQYEFAPTIFTGSTHYVVIAFNNGTGTAYIDTTPNAFTYTASTGLGVNGGNTANIVIGGSIGTYGNFAYYNGALSPARIAAHYAAAQRSTCVSTTTLANSTWHWLSGAFSAPTSTLSLNIDGSSQCSITNTAATYTGSTNALMLGADTPATPAHFWSGAIADFRTYASALSTATQNWDYTATISRFMPTHMQLWLRADYGVSTSGSSVSAWADQSPNAGTATPVPTSSPGYVANAVNGLPALSFNGTSQYLNGPSVFPNTASYSIVAVVDPTSTSRTSNFLSSQSDSGVGSHAFLINSTPYLYLYHHGFFTGTNTTPTNALTANAYNIISGVVSYSAGTYTGTTYVNGATGYTGTETNAVTDTSTQIGGFNATFPDSFQGNMAEVLLFSSALSTTDLATVTNYLRAKYAIANPAYQLAFTTEPTNTVVGTVMSPSVSVTVQDDLGNTATNYTNPITLAISSNSIVGTSVVTPSNGIATFANLAVDTTGTGYTFTANSGSLSAGTSSSFNITSASGNFLTIAAPANETAGTAQTISVTVRDNFGNVVTGSTATITIALANNSTGATLSGTLTGTPTAGVVSLSGIYINTEGTGYTIAASSGGLTTATSSAFNILPKIGYQIAFTREPANALAGATISPNILVSIEDTYGNVVTGATDSITITFGNNAGSGTLSGTTVSAVGAIRNEKSRL